MIQTRRRSSTPVRMITNGRKVKTYGSGRECDAPACDTLLTSYNRGDRCFRHQATRYPRIRGRGR